MNKGSTSQPPNICFPVSMCGPPIFEPMSDLWGSPMCLDHRHFPCRAEWAVEALAEGDYFMASLTWTSQGASLFVSGKGVTAEQSAALWALWGSRAPLPSPPCCPQLCFNPSSTWVSRRPEYPGGVRCHGEPSTASALR